MKNSVSKVVLLQAVKNVGPPKILPVEKLNMHLVPLKTELRALLNKHWAELLGENGFLSSASNATSRNGSVSYDRTHAIDFLIKKAKDEGRDRIATAIPGDLLSLLSTLMREKGYGRRALVDAYRKEAAQLEMEAQAEEKASPKQKAS
jgi:hypothetical protein